MKKKIIIIIVIRTGILDCNVIGTDITRSAAYLHLIPFRSLAVISFAKDIYTGILAYGCNNAVIRASSASDI